MNDVLGMEVGEALQHLLARAGSGRPLLKCVATKHEAEVKPNRGITIHNCCDTGKDAR